MRSQDQSSLLLVANYTSDVGYAWWLMESFWVVLAEHYHGVLHVVLAYPEINHLPPAISKAPLEPVEQNFFGGGLAELVQQCRFIRRYAVRAIYFSDRSIWSWRYLFYRMCGVRLIITHDHTPGMRTVPTGPKAWLKSLLHRMPFFTVDGAIGATEFVRRRLIDVARVPAKKCFAAPNGLPLADGATVAADLYSIFNIPANRKIMIMTGRANRYKGILFILDAMVNLDIEIRNNLHFLFVGDGPDLQLFKQRTLELALDKHCSFPGRRNDIAALLQGADFAVHASRGEVGYSLSILEYMQAGLPVIVSDNPSVCGAIEDQITGLIYQENSLDDAASAITKLVQDSQLCQKLGAQAKIFVRRFTIAQTHEGLIDAFAVIDYKMIHAKTRKANKYVN